MGFQEQFRRFLLPVSAILIILALVFLPEILGLESSEEATEVKSASQVEARSTSSSDQEQEVEKKRKNRPGVGKYLASYLSKQTRKAKPGSQAPPAVIDSEKLVSWAYVQAAGVQRKLKVNFKDAGSFYQSMDLKYSNSKNALEEYLRVFNLLFEKEEPEQGVVSVFKELEKQETQVTIALLKDLVPRKYLIDWSKVDLTEFYGNEKVKNYKLLAAADFNPSVQLVAVEYVLRPEAWQTLTTSVERIRASIVLLKDGLKSIKLYKNQRFQKNLKGRIRKTDPEWLHIDFDVNDLEAVYLIELEDLSGKRVFKKYFFNKAFNRFVLSRKTDLRTNQHIYTAQLSKNYKNHINLLEQHYRYESSRSKILNNEFPDGNFERF